MGGCTRRIAVADPALAGGFYRVEREGAAEWRWTNGNARLSIAAFGWSEQTTLWLELAWPGTYWTRPEPESAPLRLSA